MADWGEHEIATWRARQCPKLSVAADRTEPNIVRLSLTYRYIIHTHTPRRRGRREAKSAAAV